MNHLAAALLLLQAAAPTPAPDALKKLDYFVGKWAFEWNVPESPLGPAGKISGTETYRKILNGFFLESEIEASGPRGPFQGKALMGYDEKEKVYTRYETDSLGVALVKRGPMGGDAGGWNTIFWESTPIWRDGKRVTLKGNTHMYSPVNYRLRVQISVDGGEYTNFGNPWFKKVEGTGR